MSPLLRFSAGKAARRHAKRIAALRRAVFESPGKTDRGTRASAANGGPLQEPVASYAAKVTDQSYRISDADFGALKAAGLTEDQIFEITVASALGAALRRLDAGMRALGGEA
jgi:alkylhydroperoxidase family enzyme